jgi:hypothetical protein
MTTEGWIFMVGFRVFDVGLLVLWMIWFFRLRDDGDDPPGEDGGGGGGPDPAPASGPDGGGLGAPLGRIRSGGPRIRNHGPLRRRPRTRGDESPVPGPLPARVRLPRSPVPVHHRDQAT